MNKIKLSSICDIQSGGTPSRGKAEFWNGGTIPWVKIGDFTGKHIKQTAEMITPEGLAGSSAKLFPKGTILNTIFATLGEIAILDIDACTNQAIAGLTLHDERIDKEYLVYFLKSLKAYVSKIGRGVAQNNINMSILREFEVPMRSLTEQKQIAQMLLKTEEIITARKQQLSDFDTLIKARFVEMFGDPEMNPKGWQEVRLLELLDVVGGYAFKSDLFLEKGIPVLRIGNINAGFFQPVNMVYWEEDEKLDRYKMFPGDLVMSLTGTVGKEDYGNVCILGNDYDSYYLNQRNAKLEIRKNLDKYYLSELLKFSAIKKRLTGISRGVRQANISNKDILNLQVPIPGIKEQEQFAAFVNQSDKSKYVAPHK